MKALDLIPDKAPGACSCLRAIAPQDSSKVGVLGQSCPPSAIDKSPLIRKREETRLRGLIRRVHLPTVQPCKAGPKAGETAPKDALESDPRAPLRGPFQGDLRSFSRARFISFRSSPTGLYGW